jgi:hypothetical protein
VKHTAARVGLGVATWDEHGVRIKEPPAPDAAHTA